MKTRDQCIECCHESVRRKQHKDTRQKPIDNVPISLLLIFNINNTAFSELI